MSKNINVLVTFDFNKRKGIVEIQDNTYESDIKIDTINYIQNSFIEYIIDSNIGTKYVFNWKLIGKEQFITLDQYLPPPKHDNLNPLIYIPFTNPWTTLMSWSYIAHPSKGTVQNNNIYNSKNLLINKEIEINCKVIGSPIVDGDWDTFNSKKGYYFGNNS